jgi:hypothetical protein
MKKSTFLYSLLLLSPFTSCQKDHPVKVDTTGNKPPVIAAVHDSVSYTVDGKTYMANSYSAYSSGTQQVNQKVIFPDSKNLSNYELVGNPDSVLYFQRNTISSDGASLQIFFLKKYPKRHKNDGISYYPALKDLLMQFTIGKYPYAEDFERENSENGIALVISANGRSYTSNSPFDLSRPTQLKPGFQKNSTFEIISFTRATSGGYNLEAKFSAVVVDGFTEDQKRLENGYLRLYFVPFVAAE